MTETTTDISINSNALLRIGDNAISALPGNTYSGKVAASLYPKERSIMITSYPWRFCAGQQQLSKLTDIPLFKHYQNAFQLPANMIKLIRLEDCRDFEIYGTKVYSNNNSLNAEFTYIPEEANWPDYFSICMELKMSAVFARAIAEDRVKAADFNMELKEAMMIARSLDSQNRPTQHISSNAFTRVRR